MKTTIMLFFLITAISSIASQWLPDVRLTNNSSSSATNENSAHSIAVSGNHIHVTWADNRDGLDPEIYYKRSTNKGSTWEADTRLTNNIYVSYRSSIASNGSNVYIVWQDDRNSNFEIFYKYSTNNGSSWSSDIQLTNFVQTSERPVIAVWNNSLVVVWTDYRDGLPEIYFKRSTNSGISWEDDVRLTLLSGNAFWPTVSFAYGLIHVAWQDTREGFEKIFYKKSTDLGFTWSADMRISNNNYAGTPNIASDSLGVFLIWEYNNSGQWDIVYSLSTDQGNTWGASNYITTNTANQLNPSFLISGNVLHVIWDDERVSQFNTEIYHKKSINKGITWDIDERLTSNSSYSERPSIATTSENDSSIHVVWTDSRDGNTEIYYKRNLLGNLQPPTQPQNFLANAVSSSRINLSWSDNYNEANYKIDRSSDGGLNWITIAFPVQNTVFYYDSTLNSNTIYDYRILAANSVGVSPYNYTFDTTFNIVAVIHNVLIPQEYKLYQNYPNPFNPSTTIEFDIKSKGIVKLSVIDVLGNRVSILLNKDLVPGSYKIDWDAINYSSGIYFYKLEAENYADSKKMVLIK